MKRGKNHRTVWGFTYKSVGGQNTELWFPEEADHHWEAWMPLTGTNSPRAIPAQRALMSEKAEVFGGLRTL